jgi:hypothetical protein
LASGYKDRISEWSQALLTFGKEIFERLKNLAKSFKIEK